MSDLSQSARVLPLPERTVSLTALAHCALTKGAPFAVAFLLVSATVYAFKGEYAHAAFDVALATLLAVTDK